jgi:hypothetical protein
MTASYPRNPKKRVLEALQALGGGYHTRREIAGQLGRQKLWPREVYALHVLAAEGAIRVRREKSPGTMPLIWLYAAIAD